MGTNYLWPFISRMNTLAKIALAATLVTVPCVVASASFELSDKVQAGIKQILDSHEDAASQTALVSAISLELHVHGINSVANVCEAVVSKAADEASAKALAAAAATASLQYAVELRRMDQKTSLKDVAVEVGNGIATGAKADWLKAAVDSAATAANAASGEKKNAIAGAVNDGAASKMDEEAPEVVLPKANNGSNPAVDISVDTGVSK